MAELGHLSKARHVMVGVAILGTTALAALGVIGDGNPGERFDTFQSIVEPAEDPYALRITETFDQDFGDSTRHGPVRVIPNDFGVPTDVVASSPDAPADVTVIDEGAETVIRLGREDETITGQHRYTLSYTLPEAQLGRGFLAIDVLAGDEFETDLAEVVVRGFELDDPHCFVGVFGSEEPCDLVAGDGLYRATFEPLPSNQGITIDGVIVGRIAPVAVDPPPLPDRRSSNRLPVTLAVAALGCIGSFAVYRWARRRGRNEVFAGGAADAAFGDLPPPAPDGSKAASVPISLVADDRLDDLATIEFVPPKGIDPWEAAALLDERLGDDTVEAWLSGLAGREAIELTEVDDNLAIGSGPRRGELDTTDAALLQGFIGASDPYVTGEYDPEFAVAWGQVAAMQKQRIASSGWWKHLPPGGGLGGSGRPGGAPYGLIAFAALAVIWFGSAVTAFFGVFSSWPAALLLGLLFPSIVAYFVYRVLLPARSAQGSALTLRAESFRRFLHASESRHVEWAWEHGLLREYSGWAVALGEADAWSDALARSNVPAPARASAAPALLATRAASIRSSRTAPPPKSSGGSSGGFGGSSGGSVGGGGGGGSRGSW